MDDLLKIKTYDESGNLITEWDTSKGWLEDGTEFTESGEQIMNRIFHPYTEEELAKIQLEEMKAALAESKRLFTLDEVVAYFVISQINNIEVPDQTSLRMINYYPTFEEIVGQTVKMEFKFTYNGALYKTAQPSLLIQAHYIPGEGTESLYTRIDEEHTGAVYDPIPYNGNMALENNKYYTQNETVYICTRDTGSVVYHALSDLVGLYVNEV